MEIQLEKILQDLGVEVYLRKRAEENLNMIDKQNNELKKSLEELQKTLKNKVEDV